MKPKKYPQERVLTGIGGIGAVMIPFGSAWNFGGKSIVIPLLGIVVPGPADGRLWKVIPSMLELGTSDHILHILLGLIFVVGALLTRADVAREAD